VPARDPNLRLQDIADAIDGIFDYTASHSLESLAAGDRSAASKTACDLYVTYRSEKWSGRLDSNQRPLATKASWGDRGKC
jgi:hypothetical protein